MPLPFLLWGAAALVGAAGIGGHISANEKNEKAQSICNDAKSLFDNAKSDFEIVQKNGSQKLLNLGKAKKYESDKILTEFLPMYNRIKHIRLSDTDAEDFAQMSNLTFTPGDAEAIVQIAADYEAQLASGAAGAATGTLLALAAGGNLTLFGGMLLSAGELMLAGEFGLGLSLASSTIGAAFTATPLAAIAAPVLLFTAFSADSKADENLEKANVMYAEAEKKVAEMETKGELWKNIGKKAAMFQNLIGTLDEYFTASTDLLTAVINDRFGDTGAKVPQSELTEKDLELIAVTRSLAGAVKALVTAPLLTKEGKLSNEGQKQFDDCNKLLPRLKENVERTQAYDYDAEYEAMLATRKAKNKHAGVWIALTAVVLVVLAILFFKFK